MSGTAWPPQGFTWNTFPALHQIEIQSPGSSDQKFSTKSSVSPSCRSSAASANGCSASPTIRFDFSATRSTAAEVHGISHSSHRSANHKHSSFRDGRSVRTGAIAPVPSITRPFWIFSSLYSPESPSQEGFSSASRLGTLGTRGRSTGSRADRQSIDLLPASRSSPTVSSAG